MRTRLFTRISGMALAAALTLTSIQVLGFGSEARAANSGRLEGTWLLQATFVNCDTGAPGATFPALHTYMRGGTMLDTGAPPLPPGTLLRSIGHGIWERADRRSFHATFRFFRFGPTGGYVGRNEITRTIEVGENGDEFTSTSSIKIFDGNDNMIGTGCATDTGQRLEFEE